MEGTEYEDASLLNEKFARFVSRQKQSEKETLYDIDDEVDDDVVVVNDSLYEHLLRVLFKFVYRLKTHSRLVGVIAGLLLLNWLLVSSIKTPSANNQVLSISSLQDITKSLTNLQFQINELNSRNKNRLQDFKNYFDLKIDEFNVKFSKVDDIYSKLDSIDFNNIEFSGDKIPIIIDEYHNVKILPEFESFLHEYIDSYLNDASINSKFDINYKSLIENHVNDFLNSNVEFMKRDEILSLVSLQFQENKKKLIDEIKLLPNIHLSNKLINSNDFNSNDQINYSLFSSGARIINYLTSSTFTPKFKRSNSLLKWFQSNTVEDLEEIDATSYSSSPFIVLTSNDGFWRSSKVNGTTLAIKFLEPIYLSNFKYYHKKVINGSIFSSAPKVFSIFIETFDNSKFAKFSPFDEKFDNNHFKIGEFKYDINKDLEQGFTISPNFKKILIKSIIIRVDENYGNKFFTSLNKFQINGLTRLDVYSIKQLLTSEDIDEDLKHKFQEYLPVKVLGEE